MLNRSIVVAAILCAGLTACESMPSDSMPDAVFSGNDENAGEIVQIEVVQIDVIPTEVAPTDITLAESDVSEVTGQVWPTAFAAPEGVAVAGDIVLVANTAFSFDGQAMAYGRGFVSVLDLASMSVVNIISTSAKNPQSIIVADDRAYVVCSGETGYDMDSGLVRPVTNGALDEIDLSTARTAASMSRSLAIPLSEANPLVGIPKSMVLLSDGRAYLGSATAAAVFVVDRLAMTLIRGPDNPIALGDLAIQDGLTLALGPTDVVFAASFNRDLIMAIDPSHDALAGAPWAQIEIGKASDMMEGICDLAVRTEPKPELFALLCVGNSVSRVALGSGFGTVTNGCATTGVYPNRILLQDDTLLILNSGDNNVIGVSLSNGKSLGQVVAFPVGSNPYDMALAPDGRTVYVSGLMSNSLFSADLKGGAVSEVK